MGVSKKQFRTVVLIEILILMSITTAGFFFWRSFCGGSLSMCLDKTSAWSPIEFLFVTFLRPLSFSPIMITAMISGGLFGPVLGAILAVVSVSLSSLVLYIPGYYLGRRLVLPWLEENIPSLLELIKTQDYKIVFFFRWIPIFPFDLMSFMFGAANFRPAAVLIYSALGIIPEMIVFSKIANLDQKYFITQSFFYLIGFALICLLPLLAYEFIKRKSGTGLWQQLKQAYFDIVFEAQIQNAVKFENSNAYQKTPIILLYGFFSSRRSVIQLQKRLQEKGYEVISYNQGGWLGVFFTKGVREAAMNIDVKIHRLMLRKGHKKFHIVAHSKGGLVGMWWILKLGGSRFSKLIITMGTPFQGTWLAYLGIVTPLGLFWRDLWQMRPGSKVLTQLKDAEPVKDVKIYNCYSLNDRVVKGRRAIFKGRGNIVPIPIHHVSHFGFLSSRHVADTIHQILQQHELIRESKDIRR